MCIQVGALRPAVFCWMVLVRGVATVAIAHFFTLRHLSWAVPVSAAIIAPVIKSTIGCRLSRSLLPLSPLGCGGSLGEGLFFLIFSPRMCASCFFQCVYCVLVLDMRLRMGDDSGMDPPDGDGASALENFVHVAFGVSSRVLSVVLVGFCLDVVFLLVGGVLTCCQVLFWGSDLGVKLRL